MSEEYDCDGTRLPRCPSCGESDMDWWDGTTMLNDGDTQITHCPFCCEEYHTTMHLDASFSTEIINSEKKGIE